MGAINSDGIQFLDDVGRRITQVTGHTRDKAFLYQRLSVVIQRYNAVILDKHNPRGRVLAVPGYQCLAHYSSIHAQHAMCYRPPLCPSVTWVIRQRRYLQRR